MEATQGHPQKPQMRPKECWSEAHKETGQGVLDTGPDSMGDLETGRYNLKRQRQANLCKFKSSQIYIESSRTGMGTQ